MGYKAQEHVRTLLRKPRREINLTSSSRRLLDYFAFCANEEDCKTNGAYFCFPSEEKILKELCLGHGTLYRALDQLEYTCGLYLITRRGCQDGRAALYDLHILPKDLQPEAILERKQAADARLSLASGKRGARKRNTSPIGMCLPEITSQNGTHYIPKWDVITSQNGTETPEITSQNGTQNREYKRTGNLEHGIEQGGEPAPAPVKPKNPKAENENRPPSKPRRSSQDPTRPILDKHAEMWTAAVHFAEGFPLPHKFEEPDPRQLMNAGVIHVGGWTRFKGFRQRPQDASFARDEFLKYLLHHDPAYEEAVGRVVEESLAAPKEKAGARGSPVNAHSKQRSRSP